MVLTHDRKRQMAGTGAIKAALTTKQAAEESGMSARHIQRMIITGKLSATKDDSKNYMIDRAEFYRVFPEAHTRASIRQKPQDDGDSSRQALETEVRHLQAMLTEKDKKNEFLQKRLESSEAKEAALIETLNSNLTPIFTGLLNPPIYP